MSLEPDHVVDNAVEAENTDITEETEEVKGSEVNAVQGDPQEAQNPTNSANWSSRKSMLLEKKAKRSELNKMKLNEIVGKMVVLKETDGNEWLGKVVSRDVKKKADNPHKYLVQDKFGTGYRVDFLDDDWRWHQAQEEVLLVMLPRSEHNTTESMKAKDKELDLLKEFNTYEEIETTRSPRGRRSL